jgi:hypothetical protein
LGPSKKRNKPHTNYKEEMKLSLLLENRMFYRENPKKLEGPKSKPWYCRKKKERKIKLNIIYNNICM